MGRASPQWAVRGRGGRGIGIMHGIMRICHNYKLNDPVIGLALIGRGVSTADG